MMAILEYDSEFSQLLQPLQFIDEYGTQRNDYIHELEGISKIEQEEKLIKNIRQILKLITRLPEQDSYDLLNQLIITHLETM